MKLEGKTIRPWRLSTKAFIAGPLAGPAASEVGAARHAALDGLDQVGPQLGAPG